MLVRNLTFLEVLEKTTGRKPILYTDYAFAQQYITESKFAEYDLWLAEYSGATQPRIPTVWKDKGYKIWQKSDAYSIYSETTDFDEYRGALINLVK